MVEPLVLRGGVGILELVGVRVQEFEMNYADDGILGRSADGDGCDG